VNEGKWRGASDDGLGSLAQSARKSSLKQARGILIAIGVLTLIANAVLFALAEKMTKDAIAAEKAKAGPGVQFDPVKLKELEDQEIRLRQVSAAVAVVLGIAFIGLGIAVYKAPVACTVTGLVLYLAANAIYGVMDPESLAKGAIIKVIIIVFLAKAVQAAVAYQKEEAQAAAARDDMGAGHEPL
jgi:hypothetical protein